MNREAKCCLLVSFQTYKQSVTQRTFRMLNKIVQPYWIKYTLCIKWSCCEENMKQFTVPYGKARKCFVRSRMCSIYDFCTSLCWPHGMPKACFVRCCVLKWILISSCQLRTQFEAVWERGTDENDVRESKRESLSHAWNSVNKIQGHYFMWAIFCVTSCLISYRIGRCRQLVTNTLVGIDKGKVYPRIGYEGPGKEV